ncbi:MAG: hypothetical protein WD021_01825 [Rhodothermales bacterium]
MNERAKRKKWFERNEQAEHLEAEGKTVEALRLYEENVREGCDVAYTYERMAALYRALGQHGKEVEALEEAVRIEEQRGPSAQVIRLKERLDGARERLQRKGPRAPVAPREGAETARVKKVKRKEKKGCLTVVVLCLTAAALAAATFL